MLKTTYSMSSTRPHIQMRMLTRKHTSPHRTPHLNYFNRTATNKDAIESIEYNDTTLAVIESKSAGILSDRDILVSLIARGSTSTVIADVTGSTLNATNARA